MCTDKFKSKSGEGSEGKAGWGDGSFGEEIPCILVRICNPMDFVVQCVAHIENDNGCVPQAQPVLYACLVLKFILWMMPTVIL